MGAIGVWGYVNLLTYILLCHPSRYPSVSSIRTFNDEVVLYHTDDSKLLFEPGVQEIVDFDKANFMGIL